jgi:hypothetical protein
MWATKANEAGADTPASFISQSAPNDTSAVSLDTDTTQEPLNDRVQRTLEVPSAGTII